VRDETDEDDDDSETDEDDNESSRTRDETLLVRLLLILTFFLGGLFCLSFGVNNKLAWVVESNGFKVFLGDCCLFRCNYVEFFNDFSPVPTSLYHYFWELPEGV